MANNNSYIETIINNSAHYLKTVFSDKQFDKLMLQVSHLKSELNKKKIVRQWSDIYIDFIKKDFQNSYKSHNKNLNKFVMQKGGGIKIIWGDCLNAMKGMLPESVHLMVTSPPYYNAREYSHWTNLNAYLDNMRLIIREAYRVLDNHRVFVFNVGDIFDNDNIKTTSTWGKRRIPLGAYFTKIFEEEGFTFVDDFIWDKGEVQSERHKNGDKPYPFYQYPMNCYEHILIFHKHRNDVTRYPCPICGCLNVNGNAYSEIGLKSWECKNKDCFKRSKANRGKRFSLKTIMTQSRQEKYYAIETEFIKKWRRDIIKINPVIKINSKGENKLGHTAPFPIEIPEMAVKFFSYPNETVLDPFGGSFTSVIAAKELGRIGIGIELNKKMFEKSIRNNLQNKLKSFDSLKIEEFDFEQC
ncbi:MAG: site-specific DNA-methyltransferase [Endomicrobium sp.]|jgi:DNA modification methylase|nr:site-specific DNA-methyltransferase [Endomicrobium sp.]